MEWQHAGDVCGSLDCSAMFDAFSSNCESKPETKPVIFSIDSFVGAYDSHSMWSTGKLTVDCGSASYIIKPPEKPSPDPVVTPTPSPTSAPIALNSPQCYHGASLKLNDIQDKVTEFCNDAVSSGWHYEKKDTVTPDEIANNPLWSAAVSHVYSDILSQDGSKCLALEIIVNKASCTEGADFTVDFKSMGVDACVDNFMIAVNGCEFFFLYLLINLSPSVLLTRMQ